MCYNLAHSQMRRVGGGEFETALSARPSRTRSRPNLPARISLKSTCSWYALAEGLRMGWIGDRRQLVSHEDSDALL